MRKVALVIGIGEYADENHLPNAINDAKDVTNALKKIGFNIEEPKLNLTCRNIKHTLVDFEESFTSGDLVLFYFAGHGTQWEDQNYLIPSDNVGIDGTDILTRAINAQDILNRINLKKPLATIFILDCCRTYHIRHDDIDKRDRAMSTNQPKGLKGMSNEHESLIVFACAAGTTADDSKKERNGLFTKHFLKYIYSENEPVQLMLADVTNGVKQESSSKQIPYVYSSLSSKRLFLNEKLDREQSVTSNTIDTASASAKSVVEKPIEASSKPTKPEPVKNITCPRCHNTDHVYTYMAYSDYLAYYDYDDYRDYARYGDGYFGDGFGFFFGDAYGFYADKGKQDCCNGIIGSRTNYCFFELRDSRTVYVCDQKH